MKISVVIPAFNEVRTIHHILRRVLDVKLEKEVLVVDDGSTDGTREFLQRFTHPDVRVFHHETNQGKGAALRTGFQHVTGDVVIVQDADLEYDPQEYPLLVRPIEEGAADVVYGSRFIGSPRRVLNFWHSVANHFLTTLSNAFTNLTLTDMETCYKVFRSEIIKAIPLRARGFDFEPEITAKIAKLHCRIYEVGISYHGRDYSEGKKIRWHHGVQAIWTVLKFALVDDLAEIGPEFETLRVMARLDRYNDWIWSKIAPHAGQSVLEIGAGTGNMTRYLLGREHVVATDVNAQYLRMLRARFRPEDVQVAHLDITALDAAPVWDRPFDTVICLNVMEHIEGDREFLRALHARLAPGARLVLMVPAHPRLFGTLDRSVGHYRRYGRDELAARLTEAGFEVVQLRFFNLIGTIGWFVNSRLLRRRKVPSFQSRFFDWMVPLLKLEDRFDLGGGISLIAVARRK